MCSRCLSVVLLAIPLMGADVKTLRVCADPNNLPFSNQREEGFENRIAGLLARSLGAKLQYVWWSERKSLVKNTLEEGLCDVLPGVPSALEAASVTQPYYRSTYVFVSRKDRGLHISSLSDPRLENWRIGIHVVGDDFAPPAFALARRGITGNVKGYSLFGAYGEENPPARLIEAVAAGDVDVAIAWGPLAGYFAQRAKAALEVAPVSPQAFMGVPFVYDISIAVRKGNDGLRNALDAALAKNCAPIQQILRDYATPLVSGSERTGSCEGSPDSRSASWR